MLVDYHVHSDQSDGSMTPEELVAHAAATGVGTLALCDHDTTAGIRRFVAAAAGTTVQAIGGVEISATWRTGNCHILGLGVRDDYQPLEQALEKIRDSRGGRNLRIVEKLNALGIGIALAEAQRLAGGDVLGRPHIARVMMDKGYVRTVQEAFDRFLAKGSPAYVDRYRLDPPDAVQLLRDAGATVILAHPSQLELPLDKIGNLVDRLVPRGLGGLEAHTPYATDEEIAALLDIAQSRGLLVTGGSDFHGISKPDLVMGYYRPGTPIPVTGGFGVRIAECGVPGQRRKIAL